MSAEIIQFSTAARNPKRHVSDAALEAAVDRVLERRLPERPRQRAGRRRNPLRHPANQLSLAVTIAGKLANGRAEEMKGLGDYVAMLRRGAAAARFLADELDRVIAREERQP